MSQITDKRFARLDRKPWVSDHFSFGHNEDHKFPWALVVTSTGRIVARFRRKFAAQLEATKLDRIVNDVIDSSE